MTVEAEETESADEVGETDGHGQLGLSSAVGSGLLVALLVLVTVKATFPLDNNDTWFHLAIAREFLGGWSIWSPGQLTEYATEPWVPTQWSTQLLMGLAERAWGLPGVGWMYGLVYLAFALATYAACRRVGGPVEAALAAMVVVTGSFFVLTARPQSVSLIFLALTLFAWLGSVDDGRPRWWLVPLTWVWATAHGLWSVGLVVGGVCCLGMLAERRLGRHEQLKLWAVLLACLVACLATPLGPKLVTSQLAVAERSSMSSEWSATTFRDGPSVTVALMLCAVVIFWAWRQERRWTRLFLFMLSAALLVYSVRFIGIAAIVAAPLLAECLTRARSERRLPVHRAEVGVPAAALVACAVALGFVVPTTAAAPANVPRQFLDRLVDLPTGTPVFADTILGGWIEYERPGLNPVADGLFDSFSVRWLQDYEDALGAKPGWQDFVADTGARVAVLNEDTPLTGGLQDQLGWEVLQREDDWLYLVAPD